MAIVAAHLGVIDENAINDMAYIFFEDVLEELGHRLNYEAIVNYAGNSFCEKSWQMISDSNPFNLGEVRSSGNGNAMKSLADFFGKANIRMKGKGEKTDGKD